MNYQLESLFALAKEIKNNGQYGFEIKFDETNTLWFTLLKDNSPIYGVCIDMDDENRLYSLIDEISTRINSNLIDKDNKKMTVGKLIKLLQEYDQSLMVITPGYDGGYSEVSRVYSDPIKLNVHDRSFYENRTKGEHDTSHNNADTIAVVIQ